MYKKVAEFCRSCEACQHVRQHKVPRAPMIPLPVVEEPFARITMDIVGPLPHSPSGNRYILVVCDFGTRYPKAIPIRNIDTATDANELMLLFSRVGILREILTDQGTEVPQESTGYSLFELLYGRDVHGPLDILKESWCGGKQSDPNVISYIS